MKINKINIVINYFNLIIDLINLKKLKA